MASLCLPQSQLHVGVQWAEHPDLQRAISDPARPAALLFPGPGARDILTEPPDGPITLVVVDGTWSQAKNVVRDNPVLQTLPRVAFTAPEPSQYRIRKEPRADYVSTIEALMHVLGALEGKPDAFRALLDPFRAMVDAQIAAQAARPSPRSRYKRGGPPRSPTLPAALTTRYADLVFAVAEANAWPYNSGRNEPDELVHWVAYRPSTGETFEHFAAPEGELSPSTTFHTRIPEERLRAAGSRADLLAAFAAFSRPTDIVATWGTYARNLYLESGGQLGEGIDLRSVAQRLTNKKPGPLEEVAASLGPLCRPMGEGRGGVRLAAIAQIVEHWKATVARDSVAA